MGFFDRFRKRVQEVADETDLDELTAEEGTEEAEEVLDNESSEMVEVEAMEALSQHEEFGKVRTHVPAYNTRPEFGDEDDDWDDWDDEPEPLPSSTISKKERKQLEREKKRKQKEKKKLAKKGFDIDQVTRPDGSRVDLHMMRSTTGRKLVEVQQTP